MSNIQTGAERMPHDLSHLGFLAGQIGRLITISTTPVIAGDSFEMDAVGALRLSPLRRGLAIDSTVEDRKSGSAGMPRPISYAVFCLKKKTGLHDQCPPLLLYSCSTAPAGAVLPHHQLSVRPLFSVVAT